MREVKLSLLEKNYSLPLGKTIIKSARRPYYYYRKNYPKNKKDCDMVYDYPATYEIVDSDQMRLRKGDIVRISAEVKFRKNVRSEYGVILERYRIIKQVSNDYLIGII